MSDDDSIMNGACVSHDVDIGGQFSDSIVSVAWSWCVHLS